MIAFLNSNFFIGLATIVTGGVALIVYFRQKRDHKEQAARVLLMEIRTAEERIEQIRDKVATNSTTDLPLVFPTRSWKSYSHLFVSDFDHDELKLISSFYDYGELIEEFAKRNNDFFWVTTEERARVTQQQLAAIIKDAHDSGLSPADQDAYIRERRDYISSKSDQHNSPYVPQKTINEIQIYLGKLRMITTSSCGAKLKQLADLN